MTPTLGDVAHRRCSLYLIQGPGRCPLYLIQGPPFCLTRRFPNETELAVCCIRYKDSGLQLLGFSQLFVNSLFYPLSPCSTEHIYDTEPSSPFYAVLIIPTMPSRAQVFACFCESCKETGPLGHDGEPLGVVFPVSHRMAHLTRVKADRNARSKSICTQPIHSATAAEVTMAALVDTMIDEIPSSNSHLNRLWTSRDDYQDKAYGTEVSSTISSDVIHTMAESFSRLAVEPSINNIIGPMERLSVRPTPGVSPLPCSSGGSSTTTRSSNLTRRETKRERSAYTKKAHLVLSHVERGVHSCLTALSNVESNVELVPIERDIALLQHSFNSVTRKVPSIDARKQTLDLSLSQVDVLFQKLQARYPAVAVGPIVYDTCMSIRPSGFNSLPDTLIGHHFELPVNSHNPVAQLTMFIAVVCTVIMGLSRQMGNLVLNLVKLTLSWALQDSERNLTERQASILNQIPTTVETVLSKFNLDGKTTVFATCPECHCTYPPSFRPGSHTPSYPATCSNRPYPDAEVCSSSLTEEVIADDGARSSKPLKPFVVYDFHDYLASLLAQKDLEDLMDKCCDDLTASIKKSEPPPDYSSDVFQGEFIRTFQGPVNGRLFVDRPGKEGRYVFALNVDFFNSEGMTIRGASTSSGVICAACLNLPFEIRYKPENMYLAGVIPGPKEPRLTELNHYIRPIVDQFSVSWERGVRFTRTANHPNGRDTRSAIAIAVCDLPAARKVNQSAGHSSHFYCSCCNCFHRSTCGRTDYDKWRLQDPSLLRQYAEAWKNAPSRKKQDDLFAQHGIRWTELWRLPYWDPPRMLVVDSMHCLLEGLAKFHFREVLNLTNAVAERKPPIVNAFQFDFPAPSATQKVTRAKMSEVEVKQVSQIQALLLAPLADNTAGTHTSLVKALERKNKNPLVYVAESLGLMPDHQPCQMPSSFTKLHWARCLAAWVGHFFRPPVPYLSLIDSEALHISAIVS